MPDFETAFDTTPGHNHGGGGAAEVLRSVGGYQLLRVLGRGGMGVVYAGRRPNSEREVAIKVLSGGETDSETVMRFQLEAEATARLTHPGVVGIETVGSDQGRHYIVMKMIEGESLHRMLRRGPLPSAFAAAITLQLAQALDHAHRAGVLHRDLKPSNVMLTPDGQVRILDFGIAKLLDVNDSNLTTTGQLLGTPSFMAPEQAGTEGLSVDVRTDVYALGATLYAMLAGQPPFTGPSTMSVLVDVASTPPAPISSVRVGDSVDPRLEAICVRCLEKDPAHRYASATDLATALYDYLDADDARQGLSTRSAWTLGAVILGAAGLALTAVLVVGELNAREHRASLKAELAEAERKKRAEPLTAPKVAAPPKPGESPKERAAAERKAQAAEEWERCRAMLDRLLVDLGMPGSAVTIAQANKAVRLAPHVGKAYFVRGTVLLRWGRAGAALADLRRVDDVEQVGRPYTNEMLPLLRGRALFAAGFYEESLPDLVSAADFKDKGAPLNAALGETFVEMRMRALNALGRYDETCSLAGRVLTLKLNDWRLHLPLALSFAHTGRFDEAREALDRARKLVNLHNDPPSVARCALTQSRLALLEGALDEARANVSLVQSTPGVSQHLHAVGLEVLARIDLAGDKAESAVAITQDALDRAGEARHEQAEPDCFRLQAPTGLYPRIVALEVAEGQVLRGIERVGLIAVRLDALRALGKPDQAAAELATALEDSHSQTETDLLEALQR